MIETDLWPLFNIDIAQYCFAKHTRIHGPGPVIFPPPSGRSKDWAALSGIVAVGSVHVPYLLSDRRRMSGQVANIDGLLGEFC